MLTTIDNDKNQITFEPPFLGIVHIQSHDNRIIIVPAPACYTEKVCDVANCLAEKFGGKICVITNNEETLKALRTILPFYSATSTTAPETIKRIKMISHETLSFVKPDVAAGDYEALFGKKAQDLILGQDDDVLRNLASGCGFSEEKIKRYLDGEKIGFKVLFENSIPIAILKEEKIIGICVLTLVGNGVAYLSDTITIKSSRENIVKLLYQQAAQLCGTEYPHIYLVTPPDRNDEFEKLGFEAAPIVASFTPAKLSMKALYEERLSSYRELASAPCAYAV